MLIFSLALSMKHIQIKLLLTMIIITVFISNCNQFPILVKATDIKKPYLVKT